MVTLLDAEGNELATCVEQSVPGARRLLMSRVVRGKGDLLKHYFARGLRSVQVESSGFLLRGMLETSWLGCERQWIVCLTPIDAGSGPRAIAAGETLPILSDWRTTGRLNGLMKR